MTYEYYTAIIFLTNYTVYLVQILLSDDPDIEYVHQTIFLTDS